MSKICPLYKAALLNHNNAFTRICEGDANCDGSNCAISVGAGEEAICPLTSLVQNLNTVIGLATTFLPALNQSEDKN